VKEFEHTLGESEVVDEGLGGERAAAEAANGEAGTIDGDWGDDGIDAGAVGEACIDHGRAFVDAAADARDDFLDDAEQVGVVLELDGGAGESAVSFDVDEFGGGDEDIGDGIVAEEGFKGAEAEDFVEDFVDDAVLFGKGEGSGFFVDEALDSEADFAADLGLGENGDGFEVDAMEEAAMEAEFEFLVLGAGGLAAEEPGDPGGIVFER
jgi:hypothetical protein